MSLINQLTAQQLRRAADLKEKIVVLQKEFGQLAGLTGDTPSSLKTSKPARKKMSAAGIARIRAAQKARWAKINGAKVEGLSAPKPAPKKRTMSAAAKAKISAAAKARWAKIKAAKK